MPPVLLAGCRVSYSTYKLTRSRTVPGNNAKAGIRDCGQQKSKQSRYADLLSKATCKPIRVKDLMSCPTRFLVRCYVRCYPHKLLLAGCPKVSLATNKHVCSHYRPSEPCEVLGTYCCTTREQPQLNILSESSLLDRDRYAPCAECATLTCQQRVYSRPEC